MKRFSESTQLEILNNDNIRQYILWPVGPRGTLKKPTEDKYNVKEDTERNMREYEDSIKFLEKFFEIKSTIMMFYFAAIISILGNTLTTVLFIENLSLYNFRISFIIIIIIYIVTKFGANFAPFYTMRRIIIPDYIEFPDRYESLIDMDKIKDIEMKVNVQMGFLNDIVNKYMIFIRSNLIKDQLVTALRECKYIKFDKIFLRTDYYPFYDVSFSTNIYALIKQRNEEDITKELTKINGALLNARMNCGIMGIELDENEWKKIGYMFLNEISHINFDSYHNQQRDILININKNRTSVELKNDVNEWIKKITYIDVIFYIIIIILLFVLLTT